jgi:hypothetical protein
MSEGPGRYYHPGMFPIIDSVLDRRDLAPGTYDLWKLAPLNERDPSVKAGVTHYGTDLRSGDFKTRALVFGDESARISGDVVSLIQMGPRHSSELKSGRSTPILISAITIGKGYMLKWLVKQRDKNTIVKTGGLLLTLNIADMGGSMSLAQIAGLDESTIPSRTHS